MVNPAIDGAFHTYLSVHNAMLQSAADQMPPFSLHPLISIVVPLSTLLPITPAPCSIPLWHNVM